MNRPIPSTRIAFVTDERLSHSRQAQFTKFIAQLKPKFNFDIYSGRTTEPDFLKAIQSKDYSLILVPWYHYLKWKHLEPHFGALRLEGTTVAGYFADALLPFELTTLPNFHRLILLDFFRMDPHEIEVLIRSMLFQDQKSGFQGILSKHTTIYHQNWFEHDRGSTRCIDSVVNSQLIQSQRWESRLGQIRFFLTALWCLCFQDRHQSPSLEPRAELEIAEFSKRLTLKFVFENQDFTLKQMMKWLWPPENQANLMIHTLSKNSDFLRIHHFPENHKIEITAFFTPEAPILHHPGEVRGFWIEPLKLKYLKNSEEQSFQKRVTIQSVQSSQVSEPLMEILEQLKAIHMQLGSVSHEERFVLEHQISNIRFLIGAIEKKVAEKKKVA